MTIIAYRNGMLAADCSMTLDGAVLPGRVKIARRDDGVLCASCGMSGYGDAFRAWVLAGENGAPPKAEQSAGIVFRLDGVVHVFDSNEGEFAIAPDYFALGSGMAYALGAMHAGANARDAALAAIAHDQASNGAVMTLRHHDL